MGGSSQTSTTTSNSEPWKPAQSYLKDNLSNVGDLDPLKAYGGPMVTKFSQPTNSGLQGMQNLAMNSRQGMQKPLVHYSKMMDVLGGEARGKFGDPFNSVLKRTQSDAMDAVNMQAAAAGRYGGATHQGNVAREIGDVTSNAMLGQMNQSRGQLLNYGNAMPGAYQTAQTPNQTLMDAGAFKEAKQGEILQDKANRFYQNQEMPWLDAERRNALYTGAGRLGGSQTGSQTVPGPNWGQTAAGLGMQTLAGGK